MATNTLEPIGAAMRPPVYSGVAIALHWLFVLIFLVMFPLGYIMADMELSPAKLSAYSWHKSIGITALALIALRFAWRLIHMPPPLPADLPKMQKFASQIVHALLYLVIVGMPITGWTMSSAAGFTVKPFGLFALPNFVAKDQALFHTFEAVHTYLGFALLALIALHVAAALYHGLIRRDGVLGRMLPLGPLR